MDPNVFITLRERGQVVSKVAVHNVWTDVGRNYAARLMSLGSFNPDVPLETGVIRTIQLGVGGRLANWMPPDVAAAYPAGHDPHGTNGKRYNHKYPVLPAIGTLERPIRVSGGSTPYPGELGDVWLPTYGLPKLYVLRSTPTSFTIRYRVDLAGGDYIYDCPNIPLSEVGLVVNSVANPNIPYNPVVAYANFSPQLLHAGIELEVYWTVSF